MPFVNDSFLKSHKLLNLGFFEVDKEENLLQENGGKATDVEKVSEVTLSVTASMGSQVMAFADVDRTLWKGERKDVSSSAAAETERYISSCDAYICI